MNFVYSALFKTESLLYLQPGLAKFQKLGSTYTISRFAWTSTFTCDARNIKHVLGSKGGKFILPMARVGAIESLFGHGIFSSDGHSWSSSRRLLKSQFSSLDKARLTESLESHFQNLLAHLSPDTQVDLQRLFFCVAMDFATEFISGRSSLMLSDLDRASKSQQFVEDYAFCSQEAVKRMRIGPLRHFRFSCAAYLAKRRMNRYIDDFIDESLTHIQATNSPNLLQRLAEASNDRAGLRGQILHVLVAARDTTASVLSNLFHVLARDPAEYARLRGEVLASCGTAIPSVETLGKVLYLKYCIQESLRLHPVIPINAREASENGFLPYGGGIDGKEPLFIRKGHVVMYDTYSLHRDEAVFGPDVGAFHPSRWDGLRPGWGYLPFNGGHRTCLGQQLALLELEYLVARIVQTVASLEATDDQEWAEDSGLAVTCKDGVNVRIRRA